MLFQSLLFLAQSAPATGAQQPGGLLASPIVPLIAMVVIFYFLLIRPQQKRQKDLQAMVSALKTGDRVVTNGGIHGVVANIKDGPVLSLKIADNVRIDVDKSAIASVERESAAPALAAK